MYYNYTTQNASFIEQSRILRLFGVKNDKFMLLITNKDLIDVDPHDPNLSDTMKSAIVQECKDNIWYFLREVLRVPEYGGSLVPFKLSRAGLATIFLFLNGIDTYTVTPSGTGRTITMDALATYLMFNSIDINMVFCDYNEDSSKQNLSRIFHLMRELPIFSTLVKPRANINQITNETTRGNISVFKNAKLPRIGDPNVKVGELMADVMFIDDYEYIDFNDKLLVERLLKRSVIKELAIRNNKKYYGTLMSSTVNNHITPTMNTIPLHKKCIRFRPDMYDMTIEDLTQLVDMYSGYSIIQVLYSYRELGYSEEWFTNRCGCYDNRTDVIKREVLLEREY